MNSDIKMMALLLDISHYEKLLADTEYNISGNLMKRNNYKIKIEELRKKLLVEEIKD